MHSTPSAPVASTNEPLTDASLNATTGSGGRYPRLLGWLERARPLSALAKKAEPYASRLTARPGMRSFFRGDATGIPLHSILTDGPLSALVEK